MIGRKIVTQRFEGPQQRRVCNAQFSMVLMTILFVSTYSGYTVFPEIVYRETFFLRFRWGNYLKVSKFYVLILAIFWKNAVTFQGGYSSRVDTKVGNTVHCAKAD